MSPATQEFGSAAALNHQNQTFEEGTCQHTFGVKIRRSHVSYTTTGNSRRGARTLCRRKYGSETSELSLAPVVSAARLDPFNCWPIAWNRDLNTDFSFLINDFGPAMFGYVQNDQGFDIFRTQAQLTLTDPAAFHSLMIISTVRKGQLAGRSLPSMSAVWHKVEALRMMKERFASDKLEDYTSAGSIYAVMCLMGIGAQWNAIDRNEFDSSALNRLITLKGGMKVISEMHPVLETSLFGMAVINPGLLRSDLYTVSDVSVLERNQDTMVLLYGLLGFLRAAASLMNTTPRTLSQVQIVFAPGSAAYRLLTDTPNHPGILDDKQQRLQNRLRGHVVSYVFSILIWASNSQAEIFIRHLNFVLRHVHIWRNSLRLFAWALTADVSTGSLMFSTQAWQSYEMLCAGVLLDDGLRKDILGCCLDLLVGRNEVVGSVADLMVRLRSFMFRPQQDTG